MSNFYRKTVFDNAKFSVIEIVPGRLIDPYFAFAGYGKLV